MCLDFLKHFSTVIKYRDKGRNKQTAKKCTHCLSRVLYLDVIWLRTSHNIFFLIKKIENVRNKLIRQTFSLPKMRKFIFQDTPGRIFIQTKMNPIIFSFPWMKNPFPRTFYYQYSFSALQRDLDF